MTVIIPTYNRASLVGETIRNMLAQSLPPHEILVIDDGSTDETRQVVESFGGCVRYVHQRNQGPAAARNVGLVLARGKYVQFMDSDDLASLNKVELQVRALEGGADMAYCPWIQVRISDGPTVDYGHVLQGDAVPSDLPLYEWHLRDWALVLQNCLFTRDFLRRIGNFREDLVMTEDTEFLNRAFLAAPRAAFTPSCLVIYRVHDKHKLTGSGTSDVQKAVNWARALKYMVGNLEDSGKRLNAMTRLRLSHQVWRVFEQLHVASDPRASLAPPASMGNYPAAFHRLFGLWLRVIGASRARLLGAEWPRPFRARPAQLEDLRMIRAAGIQIGEKTA